MPFHIFYILVLPLVYLAAIISFWRTVKHKSDRRWRLAAIFAVVFAISTALSVYDTISPIDGVITIFDHQVPYAAVKGFFEDLSLFAIVASLLLLLSKRLSTARREVQQLARIASSSADAITSVDRTGAIRSWNLGAQMVFGYSSEEMMGQRIHRLVAEEDWDGLRQGIEQCLSEGFVRELSCRMLARGRREILTEMTLSAITDEDGRVEGISFFMRDITEQKEVQAGILHASKMTAVAALAASVVGEFGNLLTVISGRARLGAAGTDCQRSKDAFSDIESCAQRAKNVTNNLLACARRQPPVKRMGCVEDAVKAALSTMRREIFESGVSLATDFGKTPETAFDREQITQVFLNLLTNALNSTRRHAGVITVSIVARQEYIDASVRDDGPSIPPERIARAFEPFEKAGEDNAESGDSGLALYVCREIVKYHSGDISLDCTDKSTTVHVYLPVTKSVDLQPSGAVAPALSVDCCRIAVVDADGMIRDLLTQALEKKGFSVRAFARPADARTAGAEGAFDVVFVDISARTPHGREYLEHLKDGNSVSVIAIVGEAMDAEDLGRIRDGIVGCLHKPFGLDEVNELCRVFAPEPRAEKEPVSPRRI